MKILNLLTFRRVTKFSLSRRKVISTAALRDDKNVKKDVEQLGLCPGSSKPRSWPGSKKKLWSLWHMYRLFSRREDSSASKSAAQISMQTRYGRLSFCKNEIRYLSASNFEQAWIPPEGLWFDGRPALDSLRARNFGAKGEGGLVFCLFLINRLT
jgi:hypothetical protein